MKQFFQKGSKPNQLVVAFHGTGGNEYQLLTTIATLYPEASVLSNFDERVTAFLEEVWQPQKLYDEVIFIGYSNGANFILGLLEKNPTIANTVILLHPSNLGYQYVSGEFATKVIVTTGAQDELSIPGQVLSLANQLKKHFPVDFLLVDGGHGLSEEEVTKIKEVL